MATNQTEHYALNQWQLSDSVVMADFNADNQKVDAALAALNKRVDTVIADLNSRVDNAIADADQKINAMQDTATQKINAAANTAANNLEAAIAAIIPTIPHVQTGTYVGTGTYGEAHPNTLTFDFNPRILIFVDTSNDTDRATLRYTVFAMYPSTAGDWLAGDSSIVTYGRNRITWRDKSISWYTDFLYADNSAGFQAQNGPVVQHNAAGTTYHYIAIG